VKNANSSDPNFYPLSDEETVELAEEAIELDKREQQIQEQRAGAREAQQKQAEQMLKASTSRLYFKKLFELDYKK
jgi:predicted HTH transcriptional regulator